MKLLHIENEVLGATGRYRVGPYVACVKEILDKVDEVEADLQAFSPSHYHIAGHLIFPCSPLRQREVYCYRDANTNRRTVDPYPYRPAIIGTWVDRMGDVASGWVGMFGHIKFIGATW